MIIRNSRPTHAGLLHGDDPEDEEDCSLIAGGIGTGVELCQNRCARQTNRHCRVPSHFIRSAWFRGDKQVRHTHQPPTTELVDDERPHEIADPIKSRPNSGHDVGHKWTEPQTGIDDGRIC